MFLIPNGEASFYSFIVNRAGFYLLNKYDRVLKEWDIIIPAPHANQIAIPHVKMIEKVGKNLTNNGAYLVFHRFYVVFLLILIVLCCFFHIFARRISFAGREELF